MSTESFTNEPDTIEPISYLPIRNWGGGQDVTSAVIFLLESRIRIKREIQTKKGL